MKKFIHLKRIMIESGEDYGLGFPLSPKTPNIVSVINTAMASSEH